MKILIGLIVITIVYLLYYYLIIKYIDKQINDKNER
jgi:hypothetical protein